MISVCPVVESWFKVGTTSRQLEDDSGTSRSSAMHGSLSLGVFVMENIIMDLILLCGGSVSVLVVEKRMLSNDCASVWLMDTDGFCWSVPSEA